MHCISEISTCIFAGGFRHALLVVAGGISTCNVAGGISTCIVAGAPTFFYGRRQFLQVRLEMGADIFLCYRKSYALYAL